MLSRAFLDMTKALRCAQGLCFWKVFETSVELSTDAF
jgi:hypothetical protein